MDSLSREILAIQAHLDQHSHYLLKDFWSAEEIAVCKGYLNTVTEWTPGDDSPESWQETSAEVPSEIQCHVPLSLIESICGRRVLKKAHWFNLYRSGQFIRGHRDASGDIQMLFCIEAPHPVEGGQLWLNMTSNIIIMSPGDLLLFKASKLLHGTGAICQSSSARRVTYNVRLWFAGD